MGSLIEDLQREIGRNQDLLKEYEEIPTGRFGAMVIRERIEKANRAIAEMDPVKCLQALRTLEASR